MTRTSFSYLPLYSPPYLRRRRRFRAVSAVGRWRPRDSSSKLEEPFSIKASHADIMNWCNLHKPVPFKISQAWETQQRRLAKDDKQTLTYTLQQLGAVLLQVELTDDL
ncbi:LOW QUALITY PROTEIN: alpha-galactosidase A, putative [Eimeria necatrix]|uniref:Alpha-galactosidase A, putative n=1 Tax=Eimeria necatrix TaxID=51315 RepID=U6MPX3_9EIME|nr:LOW QUALITY PROTEIN: alpha-galactosidase A, putative [Eimeria necatrix]CDJ66277.1 alpha-galactosidase A, putative [Eimeria necatrix]